MAVSISDLLSSAGISAALLLIVCWIFREAIRQWISTRIKASIQHQYDEKIETHKAQLAAQNEIHLLSVRNEIERQTTVYESIRSSFSEGQKSSMERKLHAVDQLWSEVLKIRSLLPPTMTFFDIFQEDEIAKYSHFKNSKEGSQIFEIWSLQEYKEKVKSLTSTVEETRPYIGEYLWAVYHAHRVIHMRLSVLLQLNEDETSIILWYKDDVNHGVIEAILDENELKHFYHLPFGKHSWLQRTLEYKILSQFRKIISGETYLEDTLEKLGMEALEKIGEAESKAKDTSSHSARQ